MTEPDVAITDYILCAETAWFAFSLFRSPLRSKLSRYFILTFISLSVAAFLGGTTHGFFNDQAGAFPALLWWLTLLAIGVTAAGFGLSGLILLDPDRDLRVRKPAIVLLLYAIVTWFKPEFLVAILFYVPAVLLCLAGFVAWTRRHPGQGAGYGVAGILLSLLASVGQQLGVSLHPVYMTHNALYHVIMMLALWLVYLGAKKLLLKGVSKQVAADL